MFFEAQITHKCLQPQYLHVQGGRPRGSGILNLLTLEILLKENQFSTIK